MQQFCSAVVPELWDNLTSLELELTPSHDSPQNPFVTALLLVPLVSLTLLIDPWGQEWD